MEHDLITSLLPELAEKILGYLTAQELSRLSLVCSQLRDISNSDRLWLHHCMVRGWMKFGLQSDILHEEPLLANTPVISGNSPLFCLDVPKESSLTPICKWKHIFLCCHHLQQNWERGRYIVAPILRGHKDRVTAMDSNGRIVVTGSEDKTLRIWSISSSSCVWKTEAHSDSITAVRLKENTIVTGCADGGIRVFDITSGKLVMTFTGHWGSVDHLAVVGSLVVSAATDRTVRVWSLYEGGLLHTMLGHTDDIECLYTYNNHVLTGSWDRSLILWNLNTGKTVHHCLGHREMISCCQFNEEKMVSGSGDGDLRSWSLLTGRCTNVFHSGEQGEVYCLAFNKEVIVSGSSDSAVRIWTHAGKLQFVLHEHLGIVRCLSLSDERLVSGGDQKKIVVWNYRTGEKTGVLYRQPTRLYLMWVNDTRLITASPERPGTVTILSFW